MSNHYLANHHLSAIFMTFFKIIQNYYSIFDISIILQYILYNTCINNNNIDLCKNSIYHSWLYND